jgi:pimeloyl-ACP methyl ester carboxylesterase
MPILALADGSTLSYREAGAGPPVVLVHGSPGDGRAWARVMPKLTEQHRVLALDLPGYGGSTAVPIEPEGRTAKMGAAVGDLIAACAEPVWLCGHSYGGNVALHAALRDSARIRGLVLLEPVFVRALHLAGDTAGFAAAADYFAAYTRRVDAGDNAAVASMVDYWFGAGAYPRLPQPVRDFLAGAAPKNALDVKSTFAETMTAEALRAFMPSVLVVCGGASPTVAPAIAAALTTLLPRAQAQTIAGATHGMLDTHADAVAALILGVTSA